jgi:hypothetical protein
MIFMCIHTRYMNTHANPWATLSAGELDELEQRCYRAAVGLYGTASSLHEQMFRMSTLTPEYETLRARAAAIMGAAREQKDLHSEITAVIRDRAVRRGGHVLPGDRHQLVRPAGPAAPYRLPWED